MTLIDSTLRASATFTCDDIRVLAIQLIDWAREFVIRTTEEEHRAVDKRTPTSVLCVAFGAFAGDAGDDETLNPSERAPVRGR